jgi:hypothetical protein
MLKVLNTAVPIWSSRYHLFSLSIKALGAGLPPKEAFIREKKETILNKGVRDRALGANYGKLIQVMPESQREELLLVREKTRTTI